MKFSLRSSLGRGRNSVVKIISLSAGLAFGLVLLAKVSFEESFEQFFPDVERIYRVQSDISTPEGDKSFGQTPGAIAIGMKEELPGIEEATRFTGIEKQVTLIAPGHKRYDGGLMVMGDSSLFRLFPRRILAGNAEETLSRPMHVMISSRLADAMGGPSAAIGNTLQPEGWEDKRLTIGGVFETMPGNTHLQFDVVLSMASAPEIMWEGSPTNWVGNDRYQTYVKLRSGVTPADLRTGIEQMNRKHLPLEELEKAGVKIDWSLKPLTALRLSDTNAQRMLHILRVLAIALLVTAVMNYVLIAVSSLVGRAKEMAVNKCYGASATDIYDKMLTEAAVDLLISLAIAALLILSLATPIRTILDTAVADLFAPRTLLLLAPVCLFVFAVAGIVPGWMYARIPVAVAFRSYSETRRLWKLGLLFMQFIAVAFFVTLLAIVGQQYDYMLNNPPGYDCTDAAYCDLQAVKPALRQQVADEVARLPFVESVSSASELLIENRVSGNNIYLPGDNQQLFNAADLYWVSNGYLSLMRIPVVAGEAFPEEATDSLQRVMVSRSFADKLATVAGWTDGVVGRQIFVTEHSRTLNDLFTICGVYDDVRIGTIGNRDLRPTLMFYTRRPAHHLLIRFHRLDAEAMRLTAETIQRLLPDIGIDLRAYEAERIERYRDSANFRNSVFAAGLATIIIALMGLIGYVNDEVNRRRKETAIRKINGATLHDILRLYLTDVGRIALPAVLMGGVGAYFVAREWLQRFPEQAELKAVLFLLSALFVVATILITAGLRSYRAAIANPADSLKTE